MMHGLRAKARLLVVALVAGLSLTGACAHRPPVASPAVAEPAGALVGFLVLRNFMNDILFGIVFAAVAGIMVFISLDELLPSAQKYGEHHLSIYGLTGGMAVMAVSLLMFL